MNDLNIAMDLMKCFPGSFINHNGEFIAHRRANEYFNFATCADELDVKCKVLEWLSRAASKGEPFRTDLENKNYQRFMLDGTISISERTSPMMTSTRYIPTWETAATTKRPFCLSNQGTMCAYCLCDWRVDDGKPFQETQSASRP